MYLISFLQANSLAFYIITFIFGLLVGSFINVVIHRLPKMLERAWHRECCALLNLEDEQSTDQNDRFDLIIPRSRCPACGHKISAWENIPVISYLILRGKCLECKSAISLRYPIIELLSAVMVCVVAIHYGWSLQTLPAMLLTWALISLSFIDYDTQLLPDDITLPFLWLGIICNIFGLFTDIYSSLFGAIFGYLSLWSIYIIFKYLTGKEGMGYGDFKLLSMLGAWLGWQMLPLVIILSSFVGAVIGVGLILFRNHEKNQPIPFGPYLALAGWIALIAGSDIIHAYFRWSLNVL